MKIALCLSGQPRFLEECYPSIYKAIIKDARDNVNKNIDIFIHTWHDKNKIGEMYDGAYWNNNNNAIILQNTPQRIIELYNPIKYIIESSKDFGEIINKASSMFGNKNNYYVYNLVSMYYSMYKCNQLKRDKELEDNIIYDIVIRCRFDLLFPYGNIDFSKLNLNKINTDSRWGGLESACDVFAISNSSNIDIYCDMYNRIVNYNGIKEKKDWCDYFIWHTLDLHDIKISSSIIPFRVMRHNNDYIFTFNDFNGHKYLNNNLYYPITYSSYISPLHLNDIFFNSFGYKTNGIFVEIGGYDGEFQSPTCGLSDMGWTGYYIEPIQEFANLCTERHKGNNIKVDVLAISDKDYKSLKLYIDQEFTTSKINWVEYCREIKKAFTHESTIERDVFAISLNKYLTKRKIPFEFDVLNINCEGSELDILSSFALTKWMPKVVIVDTTYDQCIIFKMHKEIIKKIFKSAGYTLFHKDISYYTWSTQRTYLIFTRT